MVRPLGELIALSLVLGCTARSNAGEGSTDTDETGISIADDSDDSDDGLETGEPETGEPPCTENGCDAACSLELDECDRPMTGYCERSDLCTCVSSPPCCESAEDCNTWEHCDPEFGCILCYTTTEVDWDPVLACMLDFSPVDPIVLPYIQLEIADLQVPFTDSCDVMPAGITWLPDMQLQLCPDTCAAFEDAGQLEVSFGCPE